MVSFEKSTLLKAKEFNELLKELEKEVPLHVIRTYMATGNLLQKLDDSIIEKIDYLKALRQDGISGEMIYANAQAASHNITLSDEIQSGESLIPGFSPSVLQKIPSLKVYSYFMVFTEKELADYLNHITSQTNSNEKPKANDDSSHTDR